MVTLFTSPKPFKGHIAVIQENALRSWARLGCQVLVFGDEEGAADMCRKVGVTHIPDVGRTEWGTPLISALWAEAERLATHDVVSYVNADIILLRDFVDACRVLQGRRAMMISRRWDLDVTTLLDFDDPDCERKLRDDVRARGQLHTQGGVDYFAHGRGVLGRLPPMALGRGTWDMWLIYRARAQGALVIDSTDVVTAVHQNHDYGHHPKGREWVFNGPESQRNKALSGGPDHVWDPRDATHDLTGRGLVRRRTPLRRRLRKAAILHPALAWPLRAAIQLTRQIRR